jgi:hemerythrin-like domain-containing protein
MHAEHFRQRRVCAFLRRFAADGFMAVPAARAVGEILRHETPRHHRDEEEDLFPALRRRARPEDHIGPVLDSLIAEHRRSEAACEAVIADLAVLPQADCVKLTTTGRRRMRSFAVAMHRHLAIENGVVLALARARLTRHDLDAIARGMKSRRTGTDDAGRITT